METLPGKEEGFQNSPDCSENPDIAFENHDEITSFLAMTDCNGKQEIAPEIYSDLIITGSTNCVFTGIPLLIAGFTFGKSTNLA